MQKSFVGGVPTDLDIKKLRDEYPIENMKYGDVIPYSDVEELLQVKKRSYRFQTVTNRWRKTILRETNIIIGTVPSIGFKILNDSEKVNLSGDKLKRAAKSMRTSMIVASKVIIKNITQEEKQRLNWFTDKCAKAHATLQIKSNLELPSI